MQENNNKTPDKADDINTLLEQYREESKKLSEKLSKDRFADLEELLNGTDPFPDETAEKPAAAEAEASDGDAENAGADDVPALPDDSPELINDAGNAADINWQSHFSHPPITENLILTSELNIEGHLSDHTSPLVTDFATPESYIVKESENAENAVAADDADEDEEEDEEQHNIFVRILLKIAAFIWNSGFIIKAAIYVLLVLIISAFTSYYVISVANDVFAFVKTEHTVTVNVTDDMTRKELAYLLKRNGVIKYDWAFDLYMIYQGDDADSFLLGEHTINSSMNYSQIISELTEEKYEFIQVSVTIPEGYTVDEIIDLLVANGIGDREDFVEAINNYPYKHEFVRLLDEMGYPETRKYRLEGYLYPDTYYFYKDSDEYLIINKMLNNFDVRFWQYYESTFKADIEKMSLSFDDIVTIASMIQAEAKFDIDMESISYVFHNRLEHASQFPFLESDATIQYVLPEHIEDLTKEDLELDNPYNTYKYKGIPPGAICNPGFDALSAAIYPDNPLDEEGEPINAYFFVSNKAGVFYYAETSAGHEKNKLQAAKDNANYEN